MIEHAMIEPASPGVAYGDPFREMLARHAMRSEVLERELRKAKTKTKREVIRKMLDEESRAFEEKLLGEPVTIEEIIERRIKRQIAEIKRLAQV